MQELKSVERELLDFYMRGVMEVKDAYPRLTCAQNPAIDVSIARRAGSIRIIQRQARHCCWIRAEGLFRAAKLQSHDADACSEFQAEASCKPNTPRYTVAEYPLC